jgi:CPA2 family monovalent cation:H+ antiporter-2
MQNLINQMGILPIATTGLPPMFSLLAFMLVGVVLASLVLLKLRQSLLVAYFLCGLAIANSGLLEAVAGPQAREAVASMSDIGIMLLLFVLGMEFSLGELRHLRRYAFVGGSMQVGITMMGAGWAARFFFGLEWPMVAVIAVACALSSTAISVKLYNDIGVSASSGARFALGVAIFQDIFVILFLVLMPALFVAGGEGKTMAPMLALTLGKGVAFVAIAILLARYVIPHLLRAVADTRSRELFTLTVAGLCVGVAFLAAIMGLSLVLGAFVAGLAVSECIYKHRILSDIAPIKDLFLTIFFVSVGLGIDLREALASWQIILTLTGAIILGKTLLLGVITRAMRLSWRATAFASIGLGSAGEFSLVLLTKTSELDAWPSSVSDPLMAAMALSMAMVPVLMRFAQPLGDLLDKHSTKLHGPPAASLPPAQRVRGLAHHAIICGYGPVGRVLAASLAHEGIPSLIIDLNAEAIRELHSDGKAALFADARQPEVWNLCCIEQARLVAFTFPATPDIAGSIQFVRERNPTVTILARTKFSNEADMLQNAGADLVILDEAESGRAVAREALSVFNLTKATKTSKSLNKKLGRSSKFLL